jgi:hypothetical protein
MRLLQMRESSTFSSIELNILTSQLSPLINDCFLRQLDCFSGEPKCTQVVLQLRRHDTLITSLLSAQAKLPRLIRIARDHVTQDVPIDPFDRLEALAQMHEIKNFTYSWEKELKEGKRAKDSAHNLHELPCMIWALRVNLNRLIIALDRLADNAQVLRDETQELVDKVLGWWQTSSRTMAQTRTRTVYVLNTGCTDCVGVTTGAE